MKVGFVVNDIATESDAYTTTRLAMAAVNRGHEAWLIGAGDMACRALLSNSEYDQELTRVA